MLWREIPIFVKYKYSQKISLQSQKNGKYNILALELLEIYGKVVHEDWLRFLDEEILDVLPKEERIILDILASVERPISWEELGKAAGVESRPPSALIESGLIVELEDGMWLHDAMRERLKRDIGAMNLASDRFNG